MVCLLLHELVFIHFFFLLFTSLFGSSSSTSTNEQRLTERFTLFSVFVFWSLLRRPVRLVLGFRCPPVDEERIICIFVRKKIAKHSLTSLSSASSSSTEDDVMGSSRSALLALLLGRGLSLSSFSLNSISSSASSS